MKEEKIYRLLVENAARGIALWQGERIILANQSFADTVGYAVDEVLGFSLQAAFDLIHPQDREAARARFHALLAGNKLPKDYTCRFVRRNGETGWWSSSASLVEYGGQPALMVIYDDITERMQAEETTVGGRKLLAATLNVLPVGVCLTDEGGYYRLMNDAYCAIYEYERDEMLGQHYSVIMPPDQIALANAHYARLLSGDTGIPAERKRQRKNGSIVYIEAANALVEGAGGQKMVITTVRDITERRRGEEIIRLRLRLLEYAAEHPIDELMQKALDEIGDLTGSPIGFYHFVDEDHNTLSLQAWSTRTLAEFCRAEAKGMHYPIQEAGVWADCYHRREPVIHNDYASLQHRKGLPDGHAEVVRELVVPTLRDGRVVAILGVGNKQFDYDEQDVEIVSYIADLVWSIVEQKRADEQIRELNARLERLAMTDELTGLLNRRAFFAQGEKEISRSRRYKTPFSLLILDLDWFKAINDTYGHEVGDQALQRFAQVLAANVREIDVVARMGGEEFGVLLPSTTAQDAVKMAERIRLAVEQDQRPIQGHAIVLTVSVGVGTFDQDAAGLETIIRRADDSMYQAKRQGRNRIVFQE